MKRILHITSLLVVTLYTLVSCTKENTQVTSLSFGSASYQVALDGKVTPVLNVTPENADITGIEWSVRDTKIAELTQNNDVIGRSIGETILTAQVGNHIASCRIQVVEKLAGSIILSKETLVLRVDEASQLVATIPDAEGVSQNIIWESSDESIVTVDENGNVKGIALGGASITAGTGAATASCRVFVLPSPVIGDYYYEDGTYSSELDESKITIGLVYAVDDDGCGGRVVSHIPAKLPWADPNTRTNATSMADGLYNLEQIKKEYPDTWNDTFKALAWCVNKTEGGLEWFLPAVMELRQLFAGYCGLKWISSGQPGEGEILDWGNFPMPDFLDCTEAMGFFNKRMEAAGGTGMSSISNSLWSSTDRPDYGYCVAWRISFSSGTLDFDGQYVESEVRAIAIF